MDNYTATEIAYKNGYEQGKKDAVKHGEWKPYQTPIETRQSGWICTNCSGVQRDVSNGDTNYYPNCGAKMDGGNVK